MESPQEARNDQVRGELGEDLVVARSQLAGPPPPRRRSRPTGAE
ncbi:hypothetical protein [Kribbella sp. DT2]